MSGRGRPRRELAEAEEQETKLNQWAVWANSEHVQDYSKASVDGDVQHRMRCYLEVCV